MRGPRIPSLGIAQVNTGNRGLQSTSLHARYPFALLTSPTMVGTEPGDLYSHRSPSTALASKRSVCYSGTWAEHTSLQSVPRTASCWLHWFPISWVQGPAEDKAGVGLYCILSLYYWP